MRISLPLFILLTEKYIYESVGGLRFRRLVLDRTPECGPIESVTYWGSAVDWRASLNFIWISSLELVYIEGKFRCER